MFRSFLFLFFLRTCFIQGIARTACHEALAPWILKLAKLKQPRLSDLTLFQTLSEEQLVYAYQLLHYFRFITINGCQAKKYMEWTTTLRDKNSGFDITHNRGHWVKKFFFFLIHFFFRPYNLKVSFLLI